MVFYPARMWCVSCQILLMHAEYWLRRKQAIHGWFPLREYSRTPIAGSSSPGYQRDIQRPLGWMGWLMDKAAEQLRVCGKRDHGRHRSKVCVLTLFDLRKLCSHANCLVESRACRTLQAFATSPRAGISNSGPAMIAKASWKWVEYTSNVLDRYFLTHASSFCFRSISLHWRAESTTTLSKPSDISWTSVIWLAAHSTRTKHWSKWTIPSRNFTNIAKFS